MKKKTIKTSSSTSASSQQNQNLNQPIVTLDPRFLAGRQLVQKGLSSEGGIEIFAALVEEARAKYGQSSIETAPAYYEYGNALLRGVQKVLSIEEAEEEEENEEKMKTTTTTTNREVAAAAAERRQKQQQQQIKQEVKEETKQDDIKQEEEQDDENDKKPAAVTSSSDKDNDNSNTEMKEKIKQDQSMDVNKENGDNDDEEEGSGSGSGSGSGNDTDLSLALEMMENAYSILDECGSSGTTATTTTTTTSMTSDEKDDKSSNDNNSSKTNNNDKAKQYKNWIKEQMPRILLGIGDALSTFKRHADAADAYSRALELRQEVIQTLKEQQGATSSSSSSNKGNDGETFTIEQLQAHRKVCEATVLIAEELLACPANEDVITTETNTLIVKAKDRIEYARGYYDKARDALQETVYVMGNIAGKSKGNNNAISFASEKEDVCFIATMVMGVGTTLAALDEELEEEEDEEETKQPPIKKQKK